MRKKCIIVGGGGHGRVVLDILQNADQYDVVGFVDSKAATSLFPSLIRGDARGARLETLAPDKSILGSVDDLPRLRDQLSVTHAIVAIGDNTARGRLADKIDAWGIELINAIHPTANIAGNATIGRNVVIAAGTIVCCHCRIGDSVILNTGCIVDHECVIATAAHVCPGVRLAGRVTIEAGVMVGIGASVIQNIRIGCQAVIGAGAVVIRDVEPHTTIVGVQEKIGDNSNCCKEKEIQE